MGKHSKRQAFRLRGNKDDQTVGIPLENQASGKVAADASAGQQAAESLAPRRRRDGGAAAFLPPQGETSVRITVSKGGMKAQPALRGTWKGGDGTTYTFRAGSRVATPGGGVVRYRLSGKSMIFFHPAQPVYAVFAWVTPDR